MEKYVKAEVKKLNISETAGNGNGNGGWKCGEPGCTYYSGAGNGGTEGNCTYWQGKKCTNPNKQS